MVIIIRIRKKKKTYKYSYNKKYTYINKTVFNFIVILSSLIITAKLGSISGCRPSLLTWVKATDYTVFEAGLGLFWFVLQYNI